MQAERERDAQNGHDRTLVHYMYIELGVERANDSFCAYCREQGERIEVKALTTEGDSRVRGETLSWEQCGQPLRKCVTEWLRIIESAELLTGCRHRNVGQSRAFYFVCEHM